MSDIATYFKRYSIPVILVLAVFISLLRPTADSLNKVARKIQTNLNRIESQFYEKTQGKELFEAFRKNQEDSKPVEDLENLGLYLYFYQSDSLTHWTSNSIIPSASENVFDKGTSFVRQKNGWYMGMKVVDSVNHEALLALLPVKYAFPFENKFLKNDFALDLSIPGNIEISDSKIEGSIPVKNLQGQTLFSLYVSEVEKANDVNAWLLVSQLLILLILAYYIHWAGVKLVERLGYPRGFVCFLFIVFVIRGLTLFYSHFLEYENLELFNPVYYASSVVTPSLGDLIINTSIIFWLVLFWSHYRLKRNGSKINSLFGVFTGIVTVFVFTSIIIWVFKTLVMDSIISFEVYNLLSLSFYSLLGLVCIALLLIAHFIVTRNVLNDAHYAGAKPLTVFVVSVVTAAVFCIPAADSSFGIIIVFGALWTCLFIFVTSLILKRDLGSSARYMIIFVAIYSVLSTFLVENIYEKRERNQRQFFAGKLVTERDFVAEYMFEDLALRMGQDVFVKNFFSNPLISKREIRSRLSSLYFVGYFNKYDIRLSTYDKEGNPLKNHDTTSLQHFYDLVGEDTIKPDKLYYINDTVKNYSYLSFLQVKEDSGIVGNMVIHLLPKVYYGQNVYPELLLGENVSAQAANSKYNYAIYQHDKLIIQHGDFPYTYYWNKEFQFGDKQYTFIDVGDWEHIIYRFSNDMKVVVTERQEGLFEPVATFSYLFSFYFAAVIGILLLTRLLDTDVREGNLLSNFSLSFRTRINYSMLLIIVISFGIIGFITISFFSRQYDNFYNDRLLRKEKVLHASLEYFIQQNAWRDESLLSDRLNNALNLEVARLSEINDIDINLYDDEGNLAIASQPAIYDKGLVSRKMNPDAYFELTSTKGAQATETENIGDLSYMATYAPIRNSKGDAVAYLGIPYFERSKNINDEVSSFLVALMNVYMFLLICAAIVAYFISNSITRPLTIISEKLRILNLNKRNEPIEWNSKDEIGILIGEYNKMITELEQSARKLARSERESAWREMAKQIAHEIKNPLTPMKLSIQYLQRAIDSGAPNIEVMAKKVTKTLEEQIENLSSIATAFSSFAKMPKPQNELINLNELLRSIADLFNREDKITITFSSESESPMVFADKNQLVSVFNNLVKNAIQGIPEHRTGFIDIHVKEEEGWIVASVNDNGIGIPKELYEKVFVPNFTTKSSGTGLGLAISKQIIEGAGGNIWFESTENVGTSFYVRLRKSEGV